MNKKGLSELIATVLIVLIALAGVALAWNFLRDSFEDTGSEIESRIGCIDVELEPKKCEIVGSNARLIVQVKKGTSEGFIGVIELADGSRKVFQLNETLDTFATRTVSIPLSGGQAVRGRVAALLKNSQGILENCDLSGISVDCVSPAGGSPECVNDNECDDGNPCTTDTCVVEECVIQNSPAGTACGLASVCNGNGNCICDSDGDGIVDESLCGVNSLCDGFACKFGSPSGPTGICNSSFYDEYNEGCFVDDCCNIPFPNPSISCGASVQFVCVCDNPSYPTGYCFDIGGIGGA